MKVPLRELFNLKPGNFYTAFFIFHPQDCIKYLLFSIWCVWFFGNLVGAFNWMVKIAVTFVKIQMES